MQSYVLFIIITCILLGTYVSLYVYSLYYPDSTLTQKFLPYIRIGPSSVTTHPSIYSVTGVERDQCYWHSPHDKSILDPALKKKCETTKFKSNDPMDIKDTHSIIKQHNEGKICLVGCLDKWETRKPKLLRLLKNIGPVLDELDIKDWVLYYGGLLGLERSETVIDWDVDLDILIPMHYKEKLGNKKDIVLRKGDFVVRAGKNENMLGTIEDTKTGFYCDFFAYSVEKEENRVKITWNPEPEKPFLYVPTNDFFPIRKAVVKGLDGEKIEVPVPSNPGANLKERYGDDYMTPSYTLEDGKYLLKKK